MAEAEQSLSVDVDFKVEWIFSFLLHNNYEVSIETAVANL